MEREKLITAEEAQSILDVCETMASVAAQMGLTTLLMGGDEPSLMDAIPGLARTVKALHAARDAALVERDGLRTILDGRTTPPTDAECVAHENANGCWLVTLDWGDGGPPVIDLYSARDVRHYAERSEAKGDDLSCRVTAWRALDRDGRPCAWPTVTP